MDIDFFNRNTFQPLMCIYATTTKKNEINQEWDIIQGSTKNCRIFESKQIIV